MATNKIFKFSNIENVANFLNGAIFGGTPVTQGVVGLVGQSISFTSPSAVTVTFTQTTTPGQDPTLLKYLEIKAQIEAAIPAVKVINDNNVIGFIEVTPTSGVALSGATQVGKALLGFDGNSVSVGKLRTPPGVTAGSAQWTWAYSVNESTHVIYTWE